jgi:hypothetical protein
MRISRVVPVTYLFAAALLSLAVLPRVAHADVQSIDFDTGTLNSPLDGVGDVSFPLNDGFRPYRTEVGDRAHSGTTVGDIGQCGPEVEARGGDASGCEFFQAGTTALLSRSANSVTVFAGSFDPLGPPEHAALTAFDAEGNQLATTGLVPIDAGGFDARLSVSSDNGDIASFVVRATSGPNGESVVAGDLGIDDLVVNFADGGEPNFSIAPVNQIISLVQGQSFGVPVRVNRLNGSTGPIRLAVGGLPAGVSADPVTIPGNQPTATLTLTAAADAPDTDFVPTEATLTADPLGDPDVGSGPRTTPLHVRVARDFELSVNGVAETSLRPGNRILLRAPDCASFEVPLKVSRDIAMNRDITLDLRADGEALVTGLETEILPSPIVAPGGSLAAERTLRILLDPTRTLGFAPLILEGRAGPSGSAHAVPVGLIRAEPKASISIVPPAFSHGRTPRFGQAGTRVRVTGTGFCPGTTVEVGSEYAPAPATVLDPHTLEFNVPRYATSGQVTIVPPGRLPKYNTREALTIDSVRNDDGFAFGNYPFGSLSLGEFTKAFGASDIFIKVNPCWPFGSCPVVTGALNPIAAIEWGLFNLLPSAHCFGMALGVQHLLSGKESYRAYADAGKGGASSAYSMSSPDGPGERLDSFLDAEHVRQFSDEFLIARIGRPESLRSQLELLERELGNQREPMVNLFGEAGSHTVLAYDVEQTAEAAEIFVYNPALPFLQSEEESGTAHRNLLDRSVIHVDKVTKTWSAEMGPGEVVGGGNDGSLWVTPDGTIPDDPSLPGLGTLKRGVASMILGAADGSARGAGATVGDVFSPLLNGKAASGSGTWVSEDPDRPLEVSLEGLKRGHYTQLYTAPGFVASAADVLTAEGVRDTLTGDGSSLRFESGQERPLELQLAERSGAAISTAATLEAHASAGGSDSAGFAGDGALTYAHDGAPATFQFTLTIVRRDGGPATFASGPLAVGRGERLRAEPIDRDLRRVRLTVRDARGQTTTKVLRNRDRARGSIRLGTPRVSGRRLSIGLRLSGMRGRAIAGVSLRLMRGKRLVARKALALKDAADRQTVSWRLPRSVRSGAYRLLTDVRALTGPARGSTEAGSLSVQKSARVRVAGCRCG